MECDNCGIIVHEGCYGDFNMEDDNKSGSDDLTEPWFCEPCKAGIEVKERICELCPTRGGIFKQTDTGKWVHLICALYTPYVGFRDVVKLQVAVLEDIKTHMWGKKECTFCIDENFSRTGVCISCDAGMCRTVFHVSCGQRNGFLSDIPDTHDKIGEQEDFLFAHCKLHTAKDKLKKRKNSWLTFKSRVSKFKRSEEEFERARIDNALEVARAKYATFRRMLVPAKQLPSEFPRMFSSCPEACMMLARKAELLNVPIETGYSVSAAVSGRVVAKHEANLSEDFVNYFFKRETQMKELEVSINNGEPNQHKLQNVHKMLVQRSDQYHTKLERVLERKGSLMESLEKLHNTLCKLSGRKLKPPAVLLESCTEASLDKMEQSTRLLDSIVHRCATCKSTEDQHTMACCGTCSKYYHMNCVDPPLTRLPKKGDNYMWQCSSCDPSDKEVSDSEGPICAVFTDVDGVVRRKRAHKEPEKFEAGKADVAREVSKEKKERKDDLMVCEKNEEEEKEGRRRRKEEDYKRRKREEETAIEEKNKEVSAKEDEPRIKMVKKEGEENIKRSHKKKEETPGKERKRDIIMIGAKHKKKSEDSSGGKGGDERNKGTKRKSEAGDSSEAKKKSITVVDDTLWDFKDEDEEKKKHTKIKEKPKEQKMSVVENTGRKEKVKEKDKVRENSKEKVSEKVEEKESRERRKKDFEVKTPEVVAEESPKPVAKKGSRKKEVVVEPCCRCGTLGDPKSVCKCDECGRCYHFLTCINPPYPRNPKVNKWWSWFCEECDKSEEQVGMSSFTSFMLEFNHCLLTFCQGGYRSKKSK